MQISGKLIKRDYTPENEEAIIKLPPVDISKIKEGDEVLIKAMVDGNFPINFPLHTIIAHFPVQPKSDKIELPEKKEVNKWKFADVDHTTLYHLICSEAEKINQLIDCVAKLEEQINGLSRS